MMVGMEGLIPGKEVESLSLSQNEQPSGLAHEVTSRLSIPLTSPARLEIFAILSFHMCARTPTRSSLPYPNSRMGRGDHHLTKSANCSSLLTMLRPCGFRLDNRTFQHIRCYFSTLQPIQEVRQ
jgi:hypothetical protein